MCSRVYEKGELNFLPAFSTAVFGAVVENDKNRIKCVWKGEKGKRGEKRRKKS